jgi:23S rRNA (adenine2503-C2)-methyltransferase
MDFYGTTRAELINFCQQLGRPPIHAQTLFRAAYCQQWTSPWVSDDIPSDLREAGLAVTQARDITIGEVKVSRYDHSAKFILRLHDGKEIESVLMPEEGRITLCVSSQVGCRQGCRFCQTGRMGLIRNLDASEIVNQVLIANRWMRETKHLAERPELNAPDYVTNIVFMGMGEPLDNLDAVVKAIEILTDPYGLQMAIRKITVSTAGHLEGLRELFTRLPQACVALSLHTPFEDERSRLLPINKKWPLADLIAELKNHYPANKRRALFVQYTVLKGINDSAAHASEILRVLDGVRCKINLIPYNETGIGTFHSPSSEDLQTFRDLLHNAGMRTMVRFSKGQDVNAACGQLVRKRTQTSIVSL